MFTVAAEAFALSGSADSPRSWVFRDRATRIAVLSVPAIDTIEDQFAPREVVAAGASSDRGCGRTESRIEGQQLKNRIETESEVRRDSDRNRRSRPSR